MKKLLVGLLTFLEKEGGNDFIDKEKIVEKYLTEAPARLDVEAEVVVKLAGIAPQQFYEDLREQGLTEDITSNPEPNYSEPFYQNIFRVMQLYKEYSSR